MSSRSAAPDPQDDRIVAVALLTQRDVDQLGIGFRRLFPVQVTDRFDDLLQQLDTSAAGDDLPPTPGVICTSRRTDRGI